MLQIACNKSTILVVEVLWCGQQFIMVVERFLCMWQVHRLVSDIQMRPLQHHIILHVNVYSGRFGVTMPDYMLYMLVSVCSTTMPKHYFGLPVHWI